MTDTTLPLLQENGISPVMMTGEIVYNARKDMDHYEKRQLTNSFGPGGLVHVSHIARGDMCFIEAGKQPMIPGGWANSEFAIDAFAGWDGLFQFDDDLYIFIGIARGPPMHQDMAGRQTSAAVFAIQIGGTRTIICRSRQVIPIGAWIVWQKPIEDGLAPDTTKHGRTLTELVEFKPANAVVRPEIMHKLVRDQITGAVGDLSGLHSSQRKKYQNAWKIFEALLGIIYTGYVTLRAVGSDRQLSDAEKITVGETLGMVTINTGTAEQIADKGALANDVSLALVDAVFQCESDPATGVSHRSSRVAAFPMVIDGDRNPNQMQNEIARQQSAQYETIYQTMTTMYHNLVSRRIGWTLNGGVPGADFDVVLNRL